MALEVTLLGPPRAERDGKRVGFDTRKATALLAHLALADRPRSRAALCDLLWSAQDPDRARGALRRTLSTLRHAVGEEWIETDGDSIALRRGPGLRIDVERFRELAADHGSVESLRDAASLFSGEFLEGFAVRGSPEFDDWQMGEAGRLERELGSSLGRLVELLAVAGEHQEAVAQARRWLELDPLHEPAHRALIRLYAWTGDRAAALEQYRTCVRTLSQELGVAPVEETAALYDEVSEGTLAPPHAAKPPAPARRPTRVGAPPELALVGRADELASLLHAHAAARADGALAVIEGEAGIGKTRLALELANEVRSSGGVVLSAACHDDEAALPYGPVVDLLREVTRVAEPGGGLAGMAPQRLADASLLLPELAELEDDLPAPVPLQSPGAQVRLAESVAAVLSAVCAGPEPGMVFLDDAHAADEASLDAISHLGRRLAGLPLLLVLGWRSEAVPPGHRLRGLAADLAREGRATIVRPGRLDEAEVATLIRAADLPPSELDVEQRVYLESEGLPLFVAEYLAALHAGYERAEFPDVGGLLDARLGGLGDVARQVLGAAAVVGRSFDFDTVRRTSGRSDEETVAALEELLSHGLVREGDAEPVYDFSHGKLRERVYEQTGLARRRLLHGRVAAALSWRRPESENAALVAQHLRLAGDDAGAAEHYRRAADHSASLHAHADALEQLDASLALGYPDPAEVYERIGDLRTLIGDYGGALAGYDSAAAQCAPERLAAIEHKIGGVYQRRGDWERAEARFAAALDAAGDDRGLRARIRADLGLTLHQAGRPEHAAALAREALALAETAGDHRAQAQAHNMLGVLARGDGDLERALDELESSLALARELDDVPAQAAALNNLALVKRDAGELAAALELTQSALALCVGYGDRHREAALENNLADLHHAVGDEDEAMTHLKRAVVIFTEVGADEATRLPEIWKLVSW